MRETRSRLGQRLDEFRVFARDALHVAAVARVQNAPGNLVTDLVAVSAHFGTLAQHLLGDFETLVHDRRRTLLTGELEALLPARERELFGDLFGEFDCRRLAVSHAQHRDRRTQPQKAHAVAPLALNLVALLRQRQAIDLDDIIEHTKPGSAKS